MIVLDCCVIAIEHYVNCLVLRWARVTQKSKWVALFDFISSVSILL